MRRSACSVRACSTLQIGRLRRIGLWPFPAHCPEDLSSLGMSDACTGKLCQKDSVCHLETRPSPRATPQLTKSQHAGPHLTTKYGSPNRSNTGDPFMPSQSLAIRGNIASGNAMEIYGSCRAEQTPLSPHMCETSFRWTRWTLCPLRRSALYPILWRRPL